MRAHRPAWSRPPAGGRGRCCRRPARRPQTAICARSWSPKLERTAVSSPHFRFVTYGNFPLEEHLRQIHEEALSKFQRIEPNTAVPPQRRWETPVSAHPSRGPCLGARLSRVVVGEGTLSAALGSPRTAELKPGWRRFSVGKGS